MRVLARILARTVALAVIGIAVFVGLLWMDHTRETTLPTPAGPFAVGRTMFDWKPDTQRQILSWVWYPAAPQASPAPTEYVTDPWRRAIEQHSGILLSQFLTRDLARVHTDSFRDADVSPQNRSYPVVLMRAGLAAETAAYTSLAEDLASHGYVVVGFDAPYRTIVVVLPDETVIKRSRENDADRFTGPKQEQVATRLVQEWSADMAFALNQLERLNTSDASGRFFGRLNLQQVGVFGHSLGGATALQFCHDDARCKAGVDVDGAPLGKVITEGVTQPFLFLLSDHGGEPESETRLVRANIDSIYDRLPSDGRLEILIRGASHFGFSDDGALLKSPMMMGALHTLGAIRVAGRRQLAITSHYIDAFFDVYLKGSPAEELKNKVPYPEIEILR